MDEKPAVLTSAEPYSRRSFATSVAEKISSNLARPTAVLTVVWGCWGFRKLFLPSSSREIGKVARCGWRRRMG